MNERIDELEKQLKVARSGESIIRILSELCANYWEQRDLEKVRCNTERLEREAHAIDNDWGLARAQVFHGCIHMFTGNYDRTLECLFGALRVFQRLGDKFETAFTLKEIGNCYDLTDQYDDAIRYTQQSLDIFKALGDEKQYAYLLNNMANHQTSAGNYPRAIDCYRESLVLSQKLGNIFGQAVALLNMGELHFLMHDNTQALALYEQSSKLFESMDHLFGLSQNFFNTGKVYHSLGEYETALRYLGLALGIAEKVQYADSIRDVNKTISEVYRDMGEWTQALSHYREYNKHRNQMFNEQTSRKITVLETQYRVELHEKEAEIQRLKNEELEKTIKDLETATHKLEEMQRRIVRMEQENLVMALAMSAVDSIRAPYNELRRCCTELSGLLAPDAIDTYQRVERIEQSLDRISNILTRIRHVDVSMKKLYSDNTQMFDIHGPDAQDNQT